MNTLLYDRLAQDASHSNSGQDIGTKRPATGDSYQSLKLFIRLLWKEYRQLRPIWIALASIVLIISSLMALRIIIQHPAIMGNLILFVPCLFSLSAGALFFANEKEQGTDRWLSQWTVPTLLSFVTKYLVAFTGTGLLILFAIAIAYLFDLQFGIPENSESSSPILWAAAAIVGSYVFTSAASVIFGRVLTSAVAGGIMTIAMIFFVGDILSGGHTPPMVDSFSSIVMAASPIVFMALLTLCLIVTPMLLARRLSERSVLIADDRNSRTPSSVHQIFHDWKSPHLTTALLWKEFRQSRFWMVGLLAFTAYILSGVILLGWASKNTPFAAGVSAVYLSDGWYEGRPVERLFLFLVSIFMGVAGFCGLLTFMSDQTGRSFRFLAHQGLSPHRLWLVKQSFSFPVLLVWTGLLLVSSFRGYVTVSYLWAPWGLLTGYATFQLSILLIPQAIAAFAVGFCCCAMLLYYSLAMTLLDVPFWVLVIPMPIFLLVSSFTLSRSWMEERQGWRAAAQKFAIVAGPMAFLFVATCLFRAFEIPATPAKDLLPDRLSPATPGQIETARAYFNLLSRIDVDDLEGINIPAQQMSFAGHSKKFEERMNRDDAQEIVKDLIAITKRPDGMFTRLETKLPYDWLAISRECTQFRLLSDILREDGEKHEEKGEWEEAKQDYLAIIRLNHHAAKRAYHWLVKEVNRSQNVAWTGLFNWAKQPSTTVSDIVAVINQLKDDAVLSLKRFEEWYLAEYEMYRQRNHLDGFMPSGLLDLTYYETPWETERSRRLDDYAHTNLLKQLHSLSDSSPREMNQPSAFVFNYPWDRWWRSTPMNCYRGQTIEVDAWTWESTARNYLVILSVVAWYKEYGEFPKDLRIACQKYIGTFPIYPTRIEGGPNPYRIATNGNRFQIIPWASDEEWNQMQVNDPMNSKPFGLYWDLNDGYSIDPKKK